MKLGKLAGFKEIMKENALISSVHGIPNLVRFRSKSLILSLVWFLSILLAVAACGWFINKSVAEYMEFDVFAKTKIIREQEQVELPAFTFCLAHNGDRTPLADMLIYCKYNGTNVCNTQHFQPINVSYWTIFVQSDSNPALI